MAYTLTGITNFGTILSEDSTKDAQLFQQPIPQANSSSALVLDLFGTARSITLTGVFDTGDGTITTMISELDALANGAQTTTKTYHSDKSNANYNVLINNVRWSVEEAGINKINWEITMIEALAIS